MKPLYRAKPQDGVWWITGASSGIGRGVALEAAKRGFRVVASARRLDRAHILGAAMRVAYVLSAAMPGVLPRCPLTCRKNKLRLSLPPDLASFAIDRLQGRLKQLARLIGREPEIVVEK